LGFGIWDCGLRLTINPQSQIPNRKAPLLRAGFRIFYPILQFLKQLLKTIRGKFSNAGRLSLISEITYAL
jgi:hypothetical protein